MWSPAHTWIFCSALTFSLSELRPNRTHTCVSTFSETSINTTGNMWLPWTTRGTQNCSAGRSCSCCHRERVCHPGDLSSRALHFTWRNWSEGRLIDSNHRCCWDQLCVCVWVCVWVCVCVCVCERERQTDRNAEVWCVAAATPQFQTEHRKHRLSASEVPDRLSETTHLSSALQCAYHTTVCVCVCERQSVCVWVCVRQSVCETVCVCGRVGCMCWESKLSWILQAWCE